MSYSDYLSLIGQRATSEEVQRFFHQHGVQWSSVKTYKGSGVTFGSLELYDATLEIEFIKQLSPKSSVINKASDFIVSGVTLINHSPELNKKIGQIFPGVTLASKFQDLTQVLGQDFSESRQQGTYCWRQNNALIEVDYESMSDEISYVQLSSTSPQVVAIKEVAENFSDGALSEQDSDELGIEPEDIPYDDTPTSSDYENIPVVERQSSGYKGFIVFVLVIALALYLFGDELNF